MSNLAAFELVLTVDFGHGENSPVCYPPVTQWPGNRDNATDFAGVSVFIALNSDHANSRNSIVNIVTNIAFFGRVGQRVGFGILYGAHSRKGRLTWDPVSFVRSSKAIFQWTNVGRGLKPSVRSEQKS